MSINTLIEVKSDIKSAIEEHNITIDGGLITYADKIREIPPIIDANVLSILASQKAKFGYSNFTTIPEIETSNYTDMSHMFYFCRNLETIPLIDTSNVTNMQSMFWGCSSLTEIPQLDTSNVVNMDSMFSYCYDLEYVPLLDASNVEEVGTWFHNVLYVECDGFINLGKKSNLTFVNIQNLRNYYSVINIFKNLYDRASAGYSVAGIYVSKSVGQQLPSATIAAVTNKGWTVEISAI